jgi:hypothetical protein
MNAAFVFRHDTARQTLSYDYQHNEKNITALKIDFVDGY